MASKESSRSRLFRILMLHGYRQNEKLFYERTGSIRKILKAYCEFVYCQAPHGLPETTDQFGWWLKRSDFPESDDQSASRLDKTFAHINDIFCEKGPIDAVFGFSQGGDLTYLLCDLVNRRNTSQTDSENDLPCPNKFSSIDFKFALISASAKSREPFLAHFYEKVGPVRMPSLHIIGKGDQIVTCDRSLELAHKYFDSPTVFEHDGGHFIPHHTLARQAYVQFIGKNRLAYFSDTQVD